VSEGGFRKVSGLRNFVDRDEAGIILLGVVSLSRLVRWIVDEIELLACWY
jgi:hypothetical protein